jgi:signal transduction histidine kinase
VTVTAAATLDISLLHVVAHEMRAPITVLKRCLSLLRAGCLTDPIEAMAIIEAKAEELEGLAEIVATAARLESTGVCDELDTFDVSDLKA